MASPSRLMALGGTALLLVASVVSTPARAEDRVHRVTITSDSIPPEVKESFGQIRQGEEAVLEITVENRGKEALRIGAVQPLCACMSETSDRAIPPGSTGTISLRLETDDYAGPTTEAALIQWADAPVPVTRLELSLDVQPVLEVLPKRLVRFRGTQGRSSEQVLDLQSTDGSAFHVTKVETSVSHLSASASPVAPGHYRVTVVLSADAPAGMIRETVTVHTDLPTLPEVKLNVTGLVATRSKGAASQKNTSG